MNHSLTLSQIDLDLAHWDATRARIQANLFELYEHATYLRLKGDPTQSPPQLPAPLAGESARYLPPAVQRIGQLLQLAVELSTVIDRARELRNSMPLVFRTEQIEKIDRLIHGPSIVVGDLITPLESRSLLGNSVTEQTLSLAQLVQLMEQDYNSSRDLILRVDHVWIHLKTSLAEFEKRLNQITASAVTPDTAEGTLELQSINPLLTEARQLIEQACSRIDLDPLSIPVDLETRLSELITLAQERICQSQDARHAAAKAAALLTASLEELASFELLVASVADECCAKTDIALPAAPTAAKDLTQQASQLTHHLSTAGVNQTHAELKRLETEILDCRALLDQRLAAARAALNLRLEWRGRLDALQVKATAQSLDNDPTLLNLQITAQRLLASRPTPMSQATAAVTAYQRLLDHMKKSP